MLEPEVVRYGALDMQVCVPAEWDDEQVQAFANLENPSGTSRGWRIREAGDPLLAGDPERADCTDRFGFVHVTLDV